MSTADHAFSSVRARLALTLRRRIGSQQEDKEFDRIVRLKSIQIVCFSMLGVVTMLVTSIVGWYAYNGGDDGDLDAYYDDPNVPVRVLNALYVSQACISASSFVTVILIAQRYQLELIRKRAEWSGTNIFEIEGFRGVAVRDTTQRDYFLASYNFWKSRMAVTFLLEVVVHLAHPILWMASVNNIPATTVDHEYSTVNLTYKLFQIVMLLRLYLFYDLLLVMNPAYQNRFEVVNNDADLTSVGYQIEASLAVKMMVHKYPTLCFMVVSLTSLLVFGFTIFTLERVEGRVDMFSPTTLVAEDAFWFSFVTARTIGFGEYAPRTVLGRIAAAFCTMAGIAAASIYSGVLVAKVPLSKELKQAVEYLHTSSADNRLREAAAALIQTMYRVYVVRKTRNRLQQPGANKSSDSRSRGFAEGDIIMDPALAQEQAAAAAGLSRFGLDIANQGHKSDRLYYAIKRFRYSRKQVQSAFTQANDVVVNQKMDSLMALSHAVKKELLAHQCDFDTLEKEIIEAFNTATQHVVHYRKQGHVPV